MIGAVGRQRQSSTTEKRSKNYRQEILFGIRFNYLLFAFFEMACRKFPCVFRSTLPERHPQVGFVKPENVGLSNIPRVQDLGIADGDDTSVQWHFHQILAYGKYDSAGLGYSQTEIAGCHLLQQRVVKSECLRFFEPHP